MKTVQINEKTKIGRNVLEMLRDLAKNDNSIKFLDETDYLLSSEANREALIQGIDEVDKGEKGKTIKPSELWK